MYLIYCELSLPMQTTFQVKQEYLFTSFVFLLHSLSDIYHTRLRLLIAAKLILFSVVEGEELNDAMKAMNYPKQHRHKLVCLRQELVDAFVE